MTETPRSDLGCVLVTGANGHLGRRLAHYLARGPGARGRMRAVVRSERAAETLRALPDEERPEEIRILDYRDADALAAAARGCRFAVHLVGIIMETRANRYADAHEATSRSLADAAARAGLERVAYLSIPGAHPDSPNACLASKGRAERILLSGKVPAVVLRVPMVLGPGDVASRIVLSQALARVVPLVRGGSMLTQPIFADDVVCAILAALLRPGLEGAAIDLGGPESLPRRELLERVARLHGRKRGLVVPLPMPVAAAFAALGERFLESPPLTRPMLEIVAHDERIDSREALTRLGIDLTPLDRVLARCVGPDAEDA